MAWKNLTLHFQCYCLEFLPSLIDDATLFSPSANTAIMANLIPISWSFIFVQVWQVEALPILASRELHGMEPIPTTSKIGIFSCILVPCVHMYLIVQYGEIHKDFFYLCYFYILVVLMALRAPVF
jgi:hypothetical protein